MSHQAIERPSDHVIVIEPSMGLGPVKRRNIIDHYDPPDFFVCLRRRTVLEK